MSTTASLIFFQQQDLFVTFNSTLLVSPCVYYFGGIYCYRNNFNCRFYALKPTLHLTAHIHICIYIESFKSVAMKYATLRPNNSPSIDITFIMEIETNGKYFLSLRRKETGVTLYSEISHKRVDIFALAFSELLV